MADDLLLNKSEKLLQTCVKERKLAVRCLICNEQCSEDFQIKEEAAWQNVRENAKKWIGLDKFGEVYERVSWEKGPIGQFLHQNCKIYLASKRKFDQAAAREKSSAEHSNVGLSNQEECDLLQATSCLEVTRRRSDGLLHSQDLCIWCMSPADKRHKGRKSTVLHLINQVCCNTFCK